LRKKAVCFRKILISSGRMARALLPVFFLKNHGPNTSFSPPILFPAGKKAIGAEAAVGATAVFFVSFSCPGRENLF